MQGQPRKSHVMLHPGSVPLESMASPCLQLVGKVGSQQTSSRSVTATHPRAQPHQHTALWPQSMLAVTVLMMPKGWHTGQMPPILEGLPARTQHWNAHILYSIQNKIFILGTFLIWWDRFRNLPPRLPRRVPAVVLSLLKLTFSPLASGFKSSKEVFVVVK